MKGVSRRSHRIVWLSPQALVVAEQLSDLTGVRIPDLVEMLLRELEGGLRDAPAEAARRAEVPRPPSRGTARVIPIERARRRQAREAPLAAALKPPEAVRARARAGAGLGRPARERSLPGRRGSPLLGALTRRRGLHGLHRPAAGAIPHGVGETGQGVAHTLQPTAI